MNKTVLVLALALFAAGCSKRGIRMDSGAMEPTIPQGSVITVDYSAYDASPIERNDIVIFAPNVNREWRFAFRVAGLPGERISVENDSLLIEGRSVGYRIYSSSDSTHTTRMLTLAEDEYYVLGDNKNDALDSRYDGPIKREHIFGKVVGVDPPIGETP